MLATSANKSRARALPAGVAGELFWQFAKRDIQGFTGSVADQFHAGGTSRGTFRHRQLQGVTVGDGLAIEGDDDVAGFDAGFFSGPVGHHIVHQRAALIGQVKMFRQVGVHVLQGDAEKTAHDFAAGDETFHDAARHVHRHGETDPLAAAAAGGDPGVDAHEPAFGVNERAAGIAGIDRGIGLDEIFITVDAVDAVAVTAQSADDAHRHRLSDAERIADSQNHIADLQLVTIGQRNGGQAGGVNF